MSELMKPLRCGLVYIININIKLYLINIINNINHIDFASLYSPDSLISISKHVHIIPK